MGQPHGDPDVVVAVPGHFFHAKSLVEGLGAVVDGEHVEDQVLTLPLGLIGECADEEGTDAPALIVGMDLDARNVDLAGPVFDVEHADVCLTGGDDLPPAPVESASVGSTLRLVVPPPDRGDVVTHGRLVQLVAEFAVSRGGGPQRDGSHAEAGSRRSIAMTIVSPAPVLR